MVTGSRVSSYMTVISTEFAGKEKTFIFKLRCVKFRYRWSGNINEVISRFVLAMIPLLAKTYRNSVR